MFESHFQSFDVQSDSSHSSTRLAALRAELKRDNLDGFIVPRADEHQNEYVPKCAERLAWLTGFSGSAGFAIVLGEEAALFIDGRYTLQAQDEVDTELFVPGGHHPHAALFLAGRPCQGRSAHRLRPVDSHARSGRGLREKLAVKGAELVAVETNPIDRIWPDRPDGPRGRSAFIPNGLPANPRRTSSRAFVALSALPTRFL